MSHPQTTTFLESKHEAEEEYFNNLLKESLAISKARRWNAEELRKTAFKCFDRGFITLNQYATICERNNVLIF